MGLLTGTYKPVCVCLDAEDHFTSGCSRRLAAWNNDNPSQPAPPPPPQQYYDECSCEDGLDHFVFCQYGRRR